MSSIFTCFALTSGRWREERMGVRKDGWKGEGVKERGNEKKIGIGKRI